MHSCGRFAGSLGRGCRRTGGGDCDYLGIALYLADKRYLSGCISAAAAERALQCAIGPSDFSIRKGLDLAGQLR